MVPAAGRIGAWRGEEFEGSVRHAAVEPKSHGSKGSKGHGRRLPLPLPSPKGASGSKRKATWLCEMAEVLD